MKSRRTLVVELPPSFPDALSPVLDQVCEQIGAVVYRASAGHEGVVSIRYRFEVLEEVAPLVTPARSFVVRRVGAM